MSTDGVGVFVVDASLKKFQNSLEAADSAAHKKVSSRDQLNTLWGIIKNKKLNKDEITTVNECLEKIKIPDPTESKNFFGKIKGAFYKIFGESESKKRDKILAKCSAISSKAPSESPSEASSKASSKASSEASSESPSEASSESPSEASSESPSEASSKASSEASSEASSKASSKASSEASSESPSEASSKASSKASSEASSEAPEEASSKASSEASSESPSEASSESPSEASSKAPSREISSEEIAVHNQFKQKQMNLLQVEYQKCTKIKIEESFSEFVKNKGLSLENYLKKEKDPALFLGCLFTSDKIQWSLDHHKNVALEDSFKKANAVDLQINPFVLSIKCGDQEKKISLFAFRDTMHSYTFPDKIDSNVYVKVCTMLNKLHDLDCLSDGLKFVQFKSGQPQFQPAKPQELDKDQEQYLKSRIASLQDSQKQKLSNDKVTQQLGNLRNKYYAYAQGEPLNYLFSLQKPNSNDMVYFSTHWDIETCIKQLLSPTAEK